jgi:catechol 2,3-dioxygenase-like lactoylglutathione lyase family enzyme
LGSHRGLLHHLIITVSDLARSSPFYGAVFRYLGYELADHGPSYEDWKRWDLDTPHEISIVQASADLLSVRHVRGAVGHHHHLAFNAEDRADVDRFYATVLAPLERAGHCRVEDPPCECPEYSDGYYATFFADPDGLKYEFVVNEAWKRKKAQRAT